jgi:hypothetical protein
MLACMLGIVNKIIPEAVSDWNPHGLESSCRQAQVFC